MMLNTDANYCRARLVFNVSGTIFETFETTLKRYPKTLLSNKKRRQAFYSPHTDDYFLNRNPKCFEAILYFYQSHGSLRCPLNISVDVFEAECRFFELSNHHISEMKRKAGIIMELEQAQNETNNVKANVRRTLNQTICLILEEPNSSRKAWIYCIFSLLMIQLLILTAFIGTIPSYRSDATLHAIEVALNFWFMIELMLRFTFNANRKRFIKFVLNWIDLISVLPYLIFLMLHVKGHDQMGIFKTVKFIRVISLLRLTKHSKRLQIVGVILKSTLPHVKLQIISISMMIFVAATFVYFAEHETHDDFKSVLDGLWWATQTITSVGYGDLVPNSLFGKLFASFFMFFAVIVYVPVFSIGSIFSTIYQSNIGFDKTDVASENTDQVMTNVGRKVGRSQVSNNNNGNGVVSYQHGSSRRISMVETSRVRKQSAVYYDGRCRKVSMAPTSINSRKTSTVNYFPV